MVSALSSTMNAIRIWRPKIRRNSSAQPKISARKAM
jgi:hypothetical protein